MALKDMLRIELNEAGSAALEAIMKATGLKRTQVIHQVLAEAVRRIALGAVPDRIVATGPMIEPEPGRSYEINGRPLQNSARKERKAALGTVCIHPAASRTTGKNWKCTACGFQNPVSV